MKAIVLLFLIWLVPEAWGQTIPPVSFDYDKDGNMTARYVGSTAGMKSYSAGSADPKEEKQKEEILTVALGEQKISIYPNPTKGSVTLGVTLLDAEQKNFLRLYDTAGRLLLTVQIRSELTPVEIKGPAGMYLLDVHLGDKVSKWKIIKE